ncbi:MAG: hypothetical protein IJV14_03485 [Lachnospiraceae bacterium]|nr:hypothetical protein [Lachnospiraceae bacterium]
MNQTGINPYGRRRPAYRVDLEECKKHEKQIPDFLEDRLSVEDLAGFLHHGDVCRSCRDELQVQYLVTAGISKLETGETFNLQKELNDYVNTERVRLHRRKNLALTAYGLEITTIFAAIATAIVLIMYF